MPGAGYSFTGVKYHYFNSSAFNSFMISAEAPQVLEANEVALLPMRVRMRISRHEAPLVGRWEEIVNAENDGDLAAKLANFVTIWVYSPHTAEREMNLFTSLRNRGYTTEKCFQAFTNGDFLYVDFMVLLADAVSKEAGKTAFCYVVEDDKVPYILIGDGNVDGAWTLGFYVTAPDEKPGSGDKPESGGKPDDSGGGGCDIGSLGMVLALLGSLLLIKTIRNRR